MITNITIRVCHRASHLFNLRCEGRWRSARHVRVPQEGIIAQVNGLCKVLLVLPPHDLMLTLKLCSLYLIHVNYYANNKIKEGKKDPYTNGSTVKKGKKKHLPPVHFIIKT
jgi:hypothetical protein